MTPLIGSLTSVRRAIEQVAPTSATVLLTGETGTGKELVARAVHARSKRTAGPFVAVNAAVLSPALAASELFGHEVGAYTGAVKRRTGRFEQARRGTLFLDEIGELAADVQALLLRAIQERVIERVGGCDVIPVDVRLVAATNRDLTESVRAGSFRADLFYRLNVFPIALPPLRERRADIPALAAYFLERFTEAHGKPSRPLAPGALRALTEYDWPGNVRELQNVIERAVIASAGGAVEVDPAWLVSTAPVETARTWAEQEKARILGALRAASGRVYGPGGAAHRLGLKPTTLYGKMRKHGIRRDADWT